MSETVKDLMQVNKAGKKKAKKAKTAKKAARKHGAAKRKARRTARRSSPVPKRRSRRRARRNPGIDIAGSGGAFLGGIASRLLTKPVGRFVASKTANQFVRAAVDVAVPLVGGAVAQKWAPNIGKGMVGAAGGNLVDHGMSMIAQASPAAAPVVQKLGFGSLGDPQVFQKDGQFYLEGPAGTRQMIPVDGRTVTVDLEDGSRETMKILGPAMGGTLVQNPRGEYEVVEGLGDIAPADTVGDIAPADTVGDDDDGVGDVGDVEDGVGDVGDEEGLL